MVIGGQSKDENDTTLEIYFYNKELCLNFVCREYIVGLVAYLLFTIHFTFPVAIGFAGGVIP